jgi:hypothetical protein
VNRLAAGKKAPAKKMPFGGKRANPFAPKKK